MIILTGKKFLGVVKILLATKLHFFFLRKISHVESGLCNQMRKTVNFSFFFEVRLTSKLSFLLKFLSSFYLFFYPVLPVFQLLNFWTCFLCDFCKSYLIFREFSLSNESFVWALIDFFYDVSITILTIFNWQKCSPFQ